MVQPSTVRCVPLSTDFRAIDIGERPIIAGAVLLLDESIDQAMSEFAQDAASKRRQRLHAAIYYAGVGILVLGLTCAALIFVFSEGNEAADAADEIARGRMYQHNIELMGGKLAVYTDEFSRWFAGLWHGRTLGYTAGVLAVATATVCFVLALALSMPSPPEAARCWLIGGCQLASHVARSGKRLRSWTQKNARSLRRGR